MSLESVLEKLNQNIERQLVASQPERVVGSHRDQYIHLNSSDRDLSIWSSSSTCVLKTPLMKTIQKIELVHFEVANPRSTVEAGVNQRIVFSEFDQATDKFNVFMGHVPIGVFSHLDISGSISTAMTYAIQVDGSSVPHNKYTFRADLLSLHCSIDTALTEDSPREYRLHLSNGSYKAKDINPSTDIITFDAHTNPSDKWLPSHMVYVHTQRGTRLAQIYAWNGVVMELRVGDLSDIWSGLSMQELKPVTVESAFHTSPGLAAILGFGEKDLSVGTLVPLISIQNPAAINTTSVLGNTVDGTFGTNYSMNLSANRFVTFHNTGTSLDNTVSQHKITATLDNNAYVKYTVDLSLFWANNLTFDDGTNAPVQVDSSAITANQVANGKLRLNVDTSGVTLSSTATEMIISGFVDSPATSVTAAVVAWFGDILVVDLEYPFHVPLQYPPGLNAPSVRMVSENNLTPLQIVAPNSFDLSLARRVIFMEVRVNSKLSDPIGLIQIPEVENQTFFGRIQIDSGTLNIQYMNGDRLVGEYTFPSEVDKIEALYIRLVTEDGVEYPLNGSNFSVVFRVRTRPI